MCTTIRIVLAMVREAFLSRAALHLENLALRQQLAALAFLPPSPRGRRSCRAVMLAVAEMYIKGVSTRDAEAVMREFGLESLSSSQVSRAAKLLDGELDAWRNRPLGEIRYLLLDARYEKVREGGVVRDAAVLSVIGIGPDQRRRVLGVSCALSEAEVHWRAFLETLVARKGARPPLRMADRLFWVVLSRLWSGWREILVIVKPETVIGWHRKGFRRFWTRKSRRGKPGRPPVSSEFRGLIRRMSRENPLWGAPRIHGELRMLGFEVSEAAVSKYMPRHPKPPSQTWRTFLENHVGCLASTDFFVVPTATFSLLFVLVVLRHERRRIVHIGTTAHPTAAWVAQQIREAFSWETAPRYMIRDRDRVYGIAFRSRIKAMGIEEVVTAPRSPWQSPYVERVIGSIRRECLDHVIVLNERHLRAILLSYIDYYQRSRTHLALGKDTPERRSVQPAGAGKIVAFPQVGGLHHRYQRLAA